MDNTGNQNMSQVKSVITFYGGKIVENILLIIVKLVKNKFFRVRKSLMNLEPMKK